MKNRLTNYNFWISMVSAVLLIFQAFNFEFDIAYINEIITAVLGLLVVIGIISDPTKSASTTTTKTNQTADNETADINIESSKETTEEKCLESEITPSENDKIINAENVPIDGQDEINNDNIQDNFEVLIKQISTDLNKKMSELLNNLDKGETDETRKTTSNEDSIIKAENQVQTEINEEKEIENSEENVEKIEQKEEIESEQIVDIEQPTCHSIVNQ